MKNGRSFSGDGWSNPNDYPGMSNLENIRGREVYLQNFFWKVFKLIWKPFLILLIILIFYAVSLIGTTPSDTIKAFTFR
jgi:hypothetical protein